MTRIALLLLLIAAQQFPGIPPPGRRTATTGLMVGQVVDGISGRPVPSVIVALSGAPSASSNGGPNARAAAVRQLTGSDGRFVFRDLPVGSFGVSASKMGYTPTGYGVRRPGGPPQQITLHEGERTGDVTIRMWKQASIAGTVLDEAGDPMIGIRVRVFHRGGLPDPRRWNNVATVTTDDRGIYRFGLLDAGNYIVGVIARTVVLPLEIAQRPETAGPLIAEVGTSPFASGIQHRGVAIGLLPGSPVPPPVSGDGVLMTYPASFYPSVTDPSQAARITVSPGEERDGVAIQLAPVPSVRVSGAFSNAPSDLGTVAVRLVPVEGTDVVIDGDLPGGVTVSDRNGAFVFEAVPSGEYVLRASTRLRAQNALNDELHYAEVPVSVGNAGVEGLSIALRPGLRITGTMEFEGSSPRPQNLSAVVLSIESAGGSLPAPLPRTPPRASVTGAFETAPLPPGRYYVRVTGSPPGWMFKSATVSGHDVADTPIDLRDSDAIGVVVTFSDRWSGLSGNVQGTGAAFDANALVVVFPTDVETWSSSGFNPRRVRSVRPSKTGQYNFTVLPPGDYYVAAIKDETSADWRDAAFLQSLSRSARRVTIGDGERKTQDVRTTEVR